MGKVFLLCKLIIWFAVWWNCAKFDWRLWSARIFQRRSVQLYGWFRTASIQVVSYWSSSIRCIMACWSGFDKCMEYFDYRSEEVLETLWSCLEMCVASRDDKIWNDLQMGFLSSWACPSIGYYTCWWRWRYGHRQPFISSGFCNYYQWHIFF